MDKIPAHKKIVRLNSRIIAKLKEQIKNNTKKKKKIKPKKKVDKNK